MSARYAGVECFWAEQLDEASVRLRRYKSETDGGACPGQWGYHNGESDEVDRVAVAWSHPPGDWRRSWTIDWPKPAHDDLRWPTACNDCGYEFAEDDRWSVMSDLIYRCLNGDEVLLIGENGSRGSGPPGMLFDMSWYPNSRAGVDGIVLGAVCPNGAIWCVDAPSSSGGGWTRTGVPNVERPTVTATPSIVANDYHGYLQNGRFTDDLGG